MTARLGCFISATAVLAVSTSLLSGAAFATGFYASPARQHANDGEVDVDPKGDAVFIWFTDNSATHDRIMQLRARSADGTFGAVQTLSTTGHDVVTSPHVAVAADGSAVAVWQIDNGDANATTPVQARIRSPAGALSPILNVAPHPGGQFSFEFASPSVAVNAAGDAIFAWTGLDGSAKRRAYARKRPADGTFGPILTLSPQGVSDPRIGVSANGAAVFVWVWNDGNGHNLIQARQLSAAGALGPTKIIGQGIEGSGGGGLGTGNPQVAMDGQGNALIVWEQPDGQGACGINGCPKVFARTLSNTGAVGTLPQTFTTTKDGGFSPQVAMDKNGNALVAWLHAGVEFRARSAGGTLGSVHKFSTSTAATEPLLKGDPAGDTVAVWKDGAVIRARARSAGGTLGPVRSFSINGQTASGASVGVGTGGKAVIAWSQYDNLGQCSSGSSCLRVGAATLP